MKNPDIQLKEVPNKIFLLELQNRLRENKIKDNQLAKILSELVFASNDETELSTAYEEWANDLEEQAEIKARKGVEKDNWDNNEIVNNNQLTDNSEYQTLKECCQKNHEREIAKEQLGIKSDTNNSTNPKPNNHQLIIGLAVGVGIVILAGLIAYLVRKRNKNN